MYSVFKSVILFFAPTLLLASPVDGLKLISIAKDLGVKHASGQLSSEEIDSQNEVLAQQILDGSTITGDANHLVITAYSKDKNENIAESLTFSLTLDREFKEEEFSQGIAIKANVYVFNDANGNDYDLPGTCTLLAKTPIAQEGYSIHCIHNWIDLGFSGEYLNYSVWVRK